MQHAHCLILLVKSSRTDEMLRTCMRLLFVKCLVHQFLQANFDKTLNNATVCHNVVTTAVYQKVLQSI
jgi:hypothetical protein